MRSLIFFFIILFLEFNFPLIRNYAPELLFKNGMLLDSKMREKYFLYINESFSSFLFTINEHCHCQAQALLKSKFVDGSALLSSWQLQVNALLGPSWRTSIGGDSAPHHQHSWVLCRMRHVPKIFANAHFNNIVIKCDHVRLESA